MDRRTFLTRSVLGSGALAVGAAGCGGAPIRTELGADDALELLARLERGLARVREVPAGTIAAAMPWQVRPDLSEDVLRLTLEAFVVSDVARALPRGGRVPGALAARLAREIPVLDRSVVTHHGLLTRTPPAVRRSIDRRVRAAPAITTDVMGWIDAHAAELGVAAESRLRLRSAAASVGARLRRQSANAVIDDCIEKMDGAFARGGLRLARARSEALPLVEAIWQEVGDVPRGGSARIGAYVPRAHEPDAEETVGPAPWSARWGRPGDEEVELGAIMMPFGLITCGVTLIVGLIVLVCGCVQNAEWDGTPQGME